jgi:hypothetical protein
MSAAYMNDNMDLDWVQAPPQAFHYDKVNNRRKNSSTHQAPQAYAPNARRQTHYEDYQAKPRNYPNYPQACYSKYTTEKRQPHVPQKPVHKNSNNQLKDRHEPEKHKKLSYQEYLDSKNFKVCYNAFDNLSTDVSDETSPDRAPASICLDMRVQVMGEIVVD